MDEESEGKPAEWSYRVSKKGCRPGVNLLSATINFVPEGFCYKRQSEAYHTIRIAT